MNELRVRVALKNVIESNKATFVQDLEFQEQPRVIHQVTYSILTPPTGYYFVNISVNNATDTNRTGFGRTTGMSPSQAEYDVVIEIADYAVSTIGEDQMYEKMDADFQLFTDRIIAKLREAYWIVDTDNFKIRLSETRTITKSNLSSIWTESAQYHAMLYARLTFSIIEECTDDSTLY